MQFSGYRVFPGFLGHSVRSITSQISGCHTCSIIKKWNEVFQPLIRNRSSEFNRFPTKQHYLLFRDVEDEMMRGWGPVRVTRSRRRFQRLSRSRQQEESKQAAQSLFEMAQQITKNLREQTDPMEATKRVYHDACLRQVLAEKTANFWMANPHEVLPLYRGLCAGLVEALDDRSAIERPEARFTSSRFNLKKHWRLAADQVLLRGPLCQAKRFGCMLPDFPAFVPWQKLLTTSSGDVENSQLLMTESSPFLVVTVFLSELKALQGGIHIVPASHIKLISLGKEGDIGSVDELGPHPFVPMGSHFRRPYEDWSPTTDSVETISSLPEGSIIVTHPATLFSHGVNMSSDDVKMVQLLLMEDGLAGPEYPHTQHSWYSKWKGRHVERITLNAEHLFPTINFLKKNTEL